MLSPDQTDIAHSEGLDPNIVIQARLNNYYRGLSKEIASQPERIHSVPKRQQEFGRLLEKVCLFARGSNVLELACGVGFWTEKMAAHASSIFATDICEEALAIGRQRVTLPHVQFATADAMALKLPELRFSEVFGGFWLSHVKRLLLADFFVRLHSHLRPGTDVLFVENEYPDRQSRPFESVTREGDTYELRRLKDGSEHLVLKNYFSDGELVERLGLRATSIQIERTTYYWSLRYRLT
jgi:cyclopropane fatty-acyl-phospholipid synthase-like methyltransferase